eukprot:1469215-Prymnesium_polylepis.1
MHTRKVTRTQAILRGWSTLTHRGSRPAHTLTPQAARCCVPQLPGRLCADRCVRPSPHIMQRARPRATTHAHAHAIRRSQHSGHPPNLAPPSHGSLLGASFVQPPLTRKGPRVHPGATPLRPAPHGASS